MCDRSPHQPVAPLSRSPTFISGQQSFSGAWTQHRRHDFASRATPSIDEKDTAHRQSLPSLSEVISGAKQVLSRPLNLPERERFAAFLSRSPTAAAFCRKPPPPPLSSYATSQPSPPIKPDHGREPEPKNNETNGVYQHPPQHAAPQQHPPPIYPQPHQAQLPPGQVPLPAYPVSPRHSSALPSPYESQRPGVHPEDGDYAPARIQYDRPVHRALDAYTYHEYLQRISHSSRTIANFAEAYVRIAAEQHGVYPIPERLPTEREVADMISNANYMRSSLEAVRQTVQEANERASAAGKAKSYEDEDSHMYDSAKQNYGIGEVKKRRGRAAPPGRCHSCNRIDTPEWRRGPDGARTLCNACGLHYAKLERKRQLEARQIRPKSPQRP
ncbi:sexual development transcription factor NsdD [Verticillium alfalfae VaMs.102]|uniref:Sexual development transcription factor NsdD n=1 Tax=Verticillium alfalfae (strain VaMs.102 / ATCC MYA-4576 / FGSC 10136) TaxID=526221 RepID=C9S6A7_VERA1|nr:sexual development transcription factor NsdD [Verticillium alfalfae VaMs.102]EEY14419.1 sexual development transcription factor NsdD [Verticillium alfalfae VaMs.102]